MDVVVVPVWTYRNRVAVFLPVLIHAFNCLSVCLSVCVCVPLCAYARSCMHVYVCVVHVCVCTCVCLHDLTTQAKLGLLERLAQGVVVGDGGMIWTMEMRGYATAGRYTPEVAVENSAAGMGL